jgi:hypothetical protein
LPGVGGGGGPMHFARIKEAHRKYVTYAYDKTGFVICLCMGNAFLTTKKRTKQPTGIFSSSSTRVKEGLVKTKWSWHLK